MKTIRCGIFAFLTFALTGLAQTSAHNPIDSLFIITLRTGPAWDPAKPPAQQLHFAEHSANLLRLRREGALLIGARYAENGMLIVRASDVDAARRYLDADPSLAAGTFVIEVDAFRPFFHGSTNPPATPEALVLRAYYEAFNRHDADAVAAFCAEDVKWFSIDGDKVGTDAEHRAQLHAWLRGYFKNLPSVRSEVLSLEQAGAFLTLRERASWENKSGQRVAQDALAVYEVRDGQIRRVWYYPAVRAGSGDSRR